MKKYGVVIFDSSSSSGVVPCNWIFKKSEDGNTYCYYPPDTWTESRLNRFITTCSDPDKSWNEFGCRHMYSTDDYLKARQKAKEAEDTSNIESEIDESSGRLKKRRRRLAYTYSSDGEETNNQCMQPLKNVKAKVTKAAKSDPSLPLLPQAPQRSTKSFDQGPVCITPQPLRGNQTLPSTPAPSSIQHQLMNTPIGDQTLLALSGPSQYLPSTPAPSSIQHQLMNTPIGDQTLLALSGPSQYLPSTPAPSSIQHQLMNTPIRDQTLLALSGPSQYLPSTPAPSIIQHQSFNLAVSGQSLPATPGHSDIQSPSWVIRPPLSNSFRHSLPSPGTASSVTAFEKCMLMQFEQVKALVKEQQTSLTLLMSKVDHLMRSTGAASGAHELPDNIEFPLKNKQELDIFEDQLKDSQLKHAVIRSISTVGGATVKETTRRLLRHILTDKCARDFNWKGKNNKRAFSDLETKTIILRSVRMNPLTSKATDHSIEKEIKEWLKFASERDGGKKLRELKKRRDRSATSIRQQPDRVQSLPEHITSNSDTE